jgi:hypothetical protein
MIPPLPNSSESWVVWLGALVAHPSHPNASICFPLATRALFSLCFLAQSLLPRLTAEQFIELSTHSVVGSLGGKCFRDKDIKKIMEMMSGNSTVEEIEYAARSHCARGLFPLLFFLFNHIFVLLAKSDRAELVSEFEFWDLLSLSGLRIFCPLLLFPLFSLRDRVVYAYQCLQS